MLDFAAIRSATSRSLWLMLLVIVAAFGSANGFSQYGASQIDVLASAIATNAAPSIQELSAARSELRHLQSLLTDYAAAGPERSQWRVEIENAQKSYSSHIVRYLDLPVFPGERDRWNGVSEELDRLDSTVARILALIDMDQPLLARTTVSTDLHTNVDAAIVALQESIDFNAEQTSRAAIEIEQLRSRMGKIAFALNGLCAFLTAAGGWLLWRTLNRSSAVAQAHASELERRNQELEMFAARIAHDIVSPLAAASVALDVAETHANDDPKVRAIVGSGRRSVARVRCIVDALLDFARSGARPSSDARAELDEVLRDVLEGLRTTAESAGVEIRVKGDVRRIVRCSTGALTSVMSNLIGNAIKYMGGAQVRRVEVRVTDRPGKVRVEIADTGPGLSPALEHPTLFEPYVRAPGSGLPGLGLGLATVRRVVNAHGGEVGVESVPGNGSTFWFELQRWSIPAAPVQLAAH
jgi:nitrogen-specific signal transduction histidine kinase